MGTSAPVFRVGGKLSVISMKQFAVVLCLLPLALGEAEPGYGYGYGHQRAVAVAVAPKCVTQYSTETSQVCNNVPETVCNTEVITSTKTVTDQACSIEQKQECKTELRQVNEESCTNTEVKVCNVVSRQVPSQECENVTEKKCEQVQECTDEQQCTTENVCRNEIEQRCTSSEHCVEEQQCTTETKTVPETTYVNECVDQVTNVCDEISQVVAAPVLSYTPIAAAPAITSIAPALLPASGLVSAPASIGASSVLPAGVLSGPLSQIFRGKREAAAEAEAEADAQYLINGPYGASVANIVGAPVATVGAPVAATTVVRTPVCRQVVNKECKQVPRTVQRTV